MNISIGNSYASQDWIDALAARPRDEQVRLASSSEAEASENVLKRTASAAFDLPTGDETKVEAVARASRSIGDETSVDMDAARITDVREKLASRDIDPVRLGVSMRGNLVTAEQWKGTSDPNWVEAVAKKAALLHEKKMAESWQEESMSRKAPEPKVDMDMARPGRIISAKTVSDNDTMMDSLVPSNANSMLDSSRAMRHAGGKVANAHDASVAAIRARNEARAKEHVKDAMGRRPGHDMARADHIMPSGGLDSEAFVQRAPRDQVSMMDDIGTVDMSPEEIKEKLSALFVEKIADQKSLTQEANEERRASIRREEPKDKDRSWERLAKPDSTMSLQERLMNAWMPEKPGK